MAGESCNSRSLTQSIGAKYLKSVQILEEGCTEHRNRVHVKCMRVEPLVPIKHFALDIGGSLIKLVYFEECESCGESWPDMVQPGSPVVPRSRGSLVHIHEGVPPVPGFLHFVTFNTADIQDCIDFILARNLIVKAGGLKGTIRATGGGSFKFSRLLEEKLGIELERTEEMESLVYGVNFLLRNVSNEAFTVQSEECLTNEQQRSFVSVSSHPFPYLLVNVGSGVSIVKVQGNEEGLFERVSGSSLGGGTLVGLSRLLINVNDFDDLLRLSVDGDNTNVDMTVGDIYGQDYRPDLTKDTIASSFGKLVMREGEACALPIRDSVGRNDIAASLVRMISNNIGQIAYLNAMRYGLKHIYFTGLFIRGHPLTMRTITYAVNYWSHGEMQPFFLQHDGFVGALGAFHAENIEIPLDEDVISYYSA